VWKPVGKRLLERLRRRGEDNIKMNFRKWYGGMEWIDVVQDRGR